MLVKLGLNECNAESLVDIIDGYKGAAYGYTTPEDKGMILCDYHELMLLKIVFFRLIIVIIFIFLLLLISCMLNLELANFFALQPV